ncbi:putative helicase mot1, partial [Neolecta irregularis DAH-3]
AVQAQCLALNKVFVEVGRLAPGKLQQVPVVVQGEEDAGTSAFTIDLAEKFVAEHFDRMKRSLLSQNRLNSSKALKDARSALIEQLDLAKCTREIEQVRVMSAAASAFVAMGQLPKKLNPVIRSIMDSIKTEDIEYLQHRSANAVADLIETCSTSGKIVAVDKLIKNLCRFLCVDTSESPEFFRNESLKDIILSLKRDEERGPKDTLNREAEVKAARIKRRGAQFALAELCTRFGGDLLSKVPKLHECMIQPLTANFALPDHVQHFEPEVGQDIVDSLSILRSLIPQIHHDLHPQIIEVFPHIIKALESTFSVIRHAAARGFAAICKYIPIKGLQIVIETILPMLNDADNVKRRQGAIEFIFCKHSFAALKLNLDLV